jgi:hypothetical protein
MLATLAQAKEHRHGGQQNEDRGARVADQGVSQREHQRAISCLFVLILSGQRTGNHFHLRLRLPHAGGWFQPSDNFEVVALP